jgi:hypothetical protein
MIEAAADHAGFVALIRENLRRIGYPLQKYPERKGA